MDKHLYTFDEAIALLHAGVGNFSFVNDRGGVASVPHNLVSQTNLKYPAEALAK